MDIPKHIAGLPFKNQQVAFSTVNALLSDPLSFYEFTEIFEPLMGELALCPDPDMALNNFERFTSAIFSRSAFYGYLKTIPFLLGLLVKLFGSSQFLSDALIRNPEYLDWLADPAVLNTQKNRQIMGSELGQAMKLFPKPESKMHVLRRFKRREMLHIGVRDILGSASLETTVGELSDLADVMVEAAVDLAWQECQAKYGAPMQDEAEGGGPAKFCVIGMGKLGGRELNYSSDIDVMFIYSTEGTVVGAQGKTSRMTAHEFFNRMSERVVSALASSTKEGYVFRVDTRLRPEGDTGPLARSLESYETYYATWGEAWEKLALIKARPIAGDKKLGEEFLAMTRPFVYEKRLASSAIDEIRQVKRRIESRLASEGKTFTEVKLGYGGIREIEFSIQLLQLLHGAGDVALQNSNSLQTIDALGNKKLLSQDEVKGLDEAYRFLRRVEHFLQIVHELQVHELPSGPDEIAKLAKRIGYKDEGKITAPARFQKDYQRLTAFVHDFHQRIFGQEQGKPEQNDWGGLLEKQNASQAIAALKNIGFKDPRKAQSVLGILAHGPSYMHLSSATVREFIHLMPKLLALLKDSPDPDMALNALERIVSSQGARMGLYKLLEAHEKLLELLVVTAGNSQDLSEMFVRHPEFLEALTRDKFLSEPKRIPDLNADLAALCKEDSNEDPDKTIKSFRQYETLRIGVRDLLGLATLPTVLAELSDLADVVFQHVFGRQLAVVRRPRPFAVLALGKWGSRELGYYSDLDLIFVYDGPEAENEPYQKIAQSMMHALGETTVDGFLYKVDARLRPGGKNNVLVLSLQGYRDYLSAHLQTWEKQALTRMRFVAGDEKLGDAFVCLVEPYLYARGLVKNEAADIRSMRERMTKEKVAPEKRGSHVKLDTGGIVDVEFAVQLLQLHWGTKHRNLRHATTMDVLAGANKLGILSPADSKSFSEGYLFLRTIENKLRIVSGLSSGASREVIPEGLEDQFKLVRRLGFAGGDPKRAVDAFWKKYRDCTQAVRKAFDELCRSVK